MEMTMMSLQNNKTIINANKLFIKPLPAAVAANKTLALRPSPRPLASICCVYVSAMDSSNTSKKKKNLDTNYVVPMDSYSSSSCITRPLAEILRDLNKRVPDNILKSDDSSLLIPWFHANRMLSFYAPGWCGEIRDVIFSDNATVTVVYRVTVRGSDGEAHRESTGTVSSSDTQIVDPVAAAEQIAFCRACARFGLGLYLYHEE